MENAVVLPLSSVPAELLVTYLGDRGFSESVVQWKYLNSAYNQGRERGFCAISNGEMIGFIGIIPVTLKKGTKERDDHWLCDWSIRDPEKNRGLGGAIAAQALRASGRMIAFGGTEVAKKRWQLKANTYDLGAGMVFRRHLTLGSYISSFQRRGLLPQRMNFGAIRRIALARESHSDKKVELREGVHPSVTKLFVSGTRHWRSSYNIADLRWQLEDCPDVQAWTCISQDEDAAVLLWRSRDDLTVWKLVLLTIESANPSLSGCLDSAIGHILQDGGDSALAVISRLDIDLIQVLENSGFRRSGTISPVYFLDEEPGKSPDTIERLSFLDADDGHRF